MGTFKQKGAPLQSSLQIELAYLAFSNRSDHFAGWENAISVCSGSSSTCLRDPYDYVRLLLKLKYTQSQCFVFRL